MTNTASSKRIFNLVLGGVMVAMATVLGFIKLYDAPYGGSITVCSMLPILFFGYRCGLKWGLGAGFVNSVLQLLLGMSALKGVSAGVLVGSIFLDYLIAFTVLGLAGMFRGKIKNDALAFTLGSLVGLLWVDVVEDAGYMQEVIGAYIPALSGLTGNTLAIVYSLVYNGVYMIPEIILTCVVGFLLVQFAGNQILDKKDQ